MVSCAVWRGMRRGVQWTYVQYNINKQKGWKEQASKRQQKKERRRDCPGIKEGTLRPERLDRVRVRRGEERERENSNTDRLSLSMAGGDPTSRGRRGALGSEGLATEDGSGGSWDGGG